MCISASAEILMYMMPLSPLLADHAPLPDEQSLLSTIASTVQQCTTNDGVGLGV